MVRRQREARLLVVGNAESVVNEGGGSRIAQLRARIERLGVPITYVDPNVVTSAKVLLPYAARNGLGITLAHPTRRRFVVSLGYGLSSRVLGWLGRRCSLLYFDVHDEPVRQYRDLRLTPLPGEDVEGKSRLLAASVAAFESVGFAWPGLAAFFPSRPGQMIAPNAADPGHFAPLPVPGTDTVALVGSSAAGRGADRLLQACEIARRALPDLRLRLALNDTGGRGDLEALKRRYGGARWISFESVGYVDLPVFLQAASVCVIPHPRSEYTDLVLPLKLFDYMAAGRPVITTDCPACADMVNEHDAGVVCADDPAELARAITAVLTDRARAVSMGRNGRRAVETVHNWDRSFEPALTAITERLERARR